MFDEIFDFGLNFKTIFFVVCLAASAVILTYYYFKNGHKRLRPRAGEMALLSLVAVMTCFGLSTMVGGLLDDPEQIEVDPQITDVFGSDPVLEEEAEKTETSRGDGSRIRERERRSKNASEGKRDSTFKF